MIQRQKATPSNIISKGWKWSNVAAGDGSRFPDKKCILLTLKTVFKDWKKMDEVEWNTENLYQKALYKKINDTNCQRPNGIKN